MDFGAIIFISIGLAMDALAVSVTMGMSAVDLRWQYAVRQGLFCGVFQFTMMFFGRVTGSLFRVYIESADHWIAFALLSFIGGRMIYSFFDKNNEEISEVIPDERLFSCRNLIMPAFATSVDAVAAGIGLAVAKSSGFVVIYESVIVGVIAFIFSFLGCFAGRKTGSFLKGAAEPVGGVILVGIGIKILFDHLSG